MAYTNTGHEDNTERGSLESVEEVAGERRRVCMIILSVYPNDTRLRREAETLERSGFEVDVLCLWDGAEKKFEKLGGINVYRLLRMVPKDDIGRYILITCMFSLVSFLGLQVLHFKKRYDLIQVHNMPDYLIFIPLIQKLFGVPLVLDLHDLSVELLETKWSSWKSRALKPLVKLSERAACSFADKLITTSLGFKERLVERRVPCEKITLVLNTPDSRIFQYDSHRLFTRITQGARLHYHGIVYERVGILEAIDAVALIQDRIPGTTLSVYGRYDPLYRAKLRQKVKCLNIEDRVAFLPWLSQPEIVDIMRNAADIGIVPYLQNDFMDLANSTKTFEYLAVGLPAVASRLRAATLLFGEDCIRFAQPGSGEDLCEKIVELCLNPELRKSQVEQGRKVLSEISGEVMADRYTKLIGGLIESKVGDHGQTYIDS